MVQPIFILALAGLASAAGKPFNRLPAGQHGSSPHLHKVNNVLSRRALDTRDTCLSFEVECDSDYCLPMGSECCGNGDGSYCDAGDYCVDNGCCEIGYTCTGAPEGCDAGRQLCGDYCIPDDAVCCGDSGDFCADGETCTSSGSCRPGSGSDSDDDDDDDDIGSDGDCPLGEEACLDGCMPIGGHCCGDGYYCDPGYTCGEGLDCNVGSPDDIFTTTSRGSSATYSLAPVPDASETSASDDDDDDDDDDETSSIEETTVEVTETETTAAETVTVTEDDAESTGADETSDDGEDDGGSAGFVSKPSFLVGLLALLPLAL